MMFCISSEDSKLTCLGTKVCKSRAKLISGKNLGVCLTCIMLHRAAYFDVNLRFIDVRNDYPHSILQSSC